MMERETLERLLIDRSVGALEPDTHALLDAYINGKGAAQREAAAFDETAALARMALSKHGASVHLPALSPTLNRSIGWTTSRIGAISALAACVLVGVLVGLGLQHAWGWGDGVDRGPQQVVVYPGAASERNASVDSEEADGFWSARRLYERPTTVSRPRLIWDSPVTQPRVGGST
jgi:hypothetical protein